ncbi:MAG: flagellar FliJ family protein [Planctomycetota bacterium]
MAKFVFEFEAVLRQRKREERDQRLVVAQLERERRSLENQIRGCQRSLEQEKRDLAVLLGQERRSDEQPGLGAAVDLSGARVQANASLHLIAKAQRHVITLSGVHNRIDAARLKLLELTTRRRAVEVLRDQRYEAWKREQDRRETAELDEIATVRASRAGGVGFGAHIA